LSHGLFPRHEATHFPRWFAPFGWHQGADGTQTSYNPNGVADADGHLLSACVYADATSFDPNADVPLGARCTASKVVGSKAFYRKNKRCGNGHGHCKAWTIPPELGGSNAAAWEPETGEWWLRNEAMNGVFFDKHGNAEGLAPYFSALSLIEGIPDDEARRQIGRHYKNENFLICVKCNRNGSSDSSESCEAKEVQSAAEKDFLARTSAVRKPKFTVGSPCTRDGNECAGVGLSCNFSCSSRCARGVCVAAGKAIPCDKKHCEMADLAADRVEERRQQEAAEAAGGLE
jgi:hypothetical protein